VTSAALAASAESGLALRRAALITMSPVAPASRTNPTAAPRNHGTFELFRCPVTASECCVLPPTLAETA
jgi:hypothetical protein